MLVLSADSAISAFVICRDRQMIIADSANCKVTVKSALSRQRRPLFEIYKI